MRRRPWIGNDYCTQAERWGTVELGLLRASVEHATRDGEADGSPVVGRIERRDWWRVLLGREVPVKSLTILGARRWPDY